MLTTDLERPGRPRSLQMLHNADWTGNVAITESDETGLRCRWTLPGYVVEAILANPVCGLASDDSQEERPDATTSPSIRCVDGSTGGVSVVLPPAALEILLKRAEHLLIGLHNQIQQLAEAQRSVEVFARGSSVDLATLRELRPLLAGQRGCGALLDKLAELEERMAAEGLG